MQLQDSLNNLVRGMLPDYFHFFEKTSQIACLFFKFVEKDEKKTAKSGYVWGKNLEFAVLSLF